MNWWFDKTYSRWQMLILIVACVAFINFNFLGWALVIIIGIGVEELHRLRGRK
jgi:hypothetical protein